MRFDPLARTFRVYEGGGKGAPAAPDYAGAAATQAASSKEATTTQNWANRPTINTPWGQQSWQSAAATDPSTGQAVTDWTQNINLSPAEQQSLEGQQRITQGRTGAAEQLLGQATGATAAPIDWNKFSKVQDLEEAQQGAFAKMSAALEPGRTQQQAGLNTRLANMGLPMNSEAYNRANQALQGNFAQENKGLLAQSLAEGRSDVTSQAQLRNQQISEEAQRRGMPLNELNALLTQQQVNMPQGFAGAPSTTAAGSQPNQALTAAVAQGNYNNSKPQNNWGAGIGGVASLAGSFM